MATRSVATTALFALFLGIAASAGITTRISVDSSGHQANDYTAWMTLSSDGRFAAFESNATNLVADDTNNARDVFVHDRLTGETTRISVNSDGVQGNGDSRFPNGISDDGRLVVFVSLASNLTPDDTNGKMDVFVHDRVSHETRRVSVDSSGAQGNGDSGSFGLALSGDGRVAAFTSEAINLATGDTNLVADIFIHEIDSGATTRVSVSSAGVQGNDMSMAPVISADGAVITFSSWATNLVPADNNGVLDTFRHDRIIHTTTRVSVSTSGAEGDRTSHGTSMSADGNLVVLDSEATNLVPGDTNNWSDVFVHDVRTGETRLISTDLAGRTFTEASWGGMMSPEGGFVVFANRIFPPDSIRVYVHELATRLTALVSVNSDGDRANSAVNGPFCITRDGRLTAFLSYADNLVPDDTNKQWDGFVHQRAEMQLNGVPADQNPVSFSVTAGERGNLALVLISCTGTSGFLFGGRWLPITLDVCTVAGLQALPFLTATVDDQGVATTPSFQFPAINPGVPFYATALTIDAVGAIESVTSPITFASQ